MNPIDQANLQIAANAEFALKVALANKHPDLSRAAEVFGDETDQQNARAIDLRFAEKVQRDGCMPDFGTYEAAYVQALQAGELKLPAAEDEDYTRLSKEEQEIFDNASTAEIREFFEEQQPARPTNAADYLTGEGSYRYKQAHSPLDENALAALRQSLGGKQ